MSTALVVFGVVVLALVALLIVASRKPDTFDVSRSVTVNAPAEKIFPWFENPRRMNVWNPFVKADPAIRLDYSGPESGVGATNRWEGNSQVGAGSAEVVESRPFSNIVVALRMIRPMKGENRVEYIFEPRGEATLVTWRMSGKQPLIGKLVSIFLNCEKMVGGPFEKGLAEMKGIVEKQ